MRKTVCAKDTWSCRKMMNRVAAQNARDKKKSYLESLEKKMEELEEEVRCLSGCGSS